MGYRSLAAAAAVASGLLMLALPAVPGAEAASSPSAAHTTPAQLRKLMVRGDKECIQPPKHFDLKALSDAQLALYGLPTRKLVDSDRSYWSRMLSHYKHRACGPDIVMPSRGPEIVRARTGKAGNSVRPDVTGSGSNWAGNYATGARGTYRQAEVSFNVPRVSGHIGAIASFWAGVGGATANPSLVQAGASVMVCPDGYTGPECLDDEDLPKSGGTWLYNYALYEVVNPSCSADINYCHQVVMTGMSIYPGDSLSVYVSSNAQNDGYDYFSVCNNTSGTCANPSEYFTSDSFSDSATGECIGEEQVLSNTGSDYYEANFGTEELDGCYLVNSSGQGNGIGAWPHNYFWVKDNAGYTLVSVGSITDSSDYPLYYCTNADTTDDECG